MQSESQTRKEQIDKQLENAGWKISDPSQVQLEFYIPSKDGTAHDQGTEYGGNFFSDYVLLGKDGKPTAVIEAKKTSVDAARGREQAKQYCLRIEAEMGVDLPFCFYTNGHEIYFWDLENYPPRKVHGFPTRDDIQRFTNLRAIRRPLAGQPINTRIAGRDYQQKAIRAVLEAMEAKRRKMLLVMATGTGKTRTCIALVETIMRAGWAERILFLVDRIALREQALDAFKEHLPDEPRWPRLGEKSFAKDRRIYVATYPTMLNVIQNEEQILSPHFFDFIVVDESHRSIYNTYQEILDYFSCITLGLTATPTDAIDHNTFKLFNTEDGVPTFAYSYEEAVNNVPPYLCNFQVLKIVTRFQEEGLSKRTITLDDQKKLLAEGKEIEEINYEGTELEKTVSNRGTNALIVKAFMEDSIKDSDGVLPGKTIFFCVSIKHAREVESIFDALYPEYKGELAKVLVSDDPRVYGKGGLLDQFKNQNLPRIAISVDMLDTGIDVLELVNLVFAKPVFSYTKFWQMIGRGTRLLEPQKIKPWCTEKDSFLILDCWDNFEYFKLNPKGREPSIQIPLPVRLFGLRLDKVEKAMELGKIEIAKSEFRKLEIQVAGLPKQSIVIKEAAADLAKTQEPGFWSSFNIQTVDFLRAQIKPLFRTVQANADFKAMRFEKDVVETSLALLSGEKEKFEVLKDGLIETISELPLTINSVAAETLLIKKAQTLGYWSNVSESDFDQLIDRLGPLVKYIDFSQTGTGMARFNLQDFIVKKEFVEFGPQHESVSISKYKAMVEERINEMTASNPILQKLKAGLEISESEAVMLAEDLYEEHPNITLDLLRRVYQNQKAQLLQFVRHILGLEVLASFPATVSKAFEDFLSTHSYLSSRQLQFLEMLKGYMIERGEIQKRNLIESPFTLIHPEGIRGVFNQREIDEILGLTQKLMAA